MNINELNEFVDREKIYILEDNCESLGAKIENKEQELLELCLHTASFSPYFNNGRRDDFN